MKLPRLASKATLWCCENGEKDPADQLYLRHHHHWLITFTLCRLLDVVYVIWIIKFLEVEGSVCLHLHTGQMCRSQSRALLDGLTGALWVSGKRSCTPEEGFMCLLSCTASFFWGGISYRTWTLPLVSRLHSHGYSRTWSACLPATACVPGTHGQAWLLHRC